jgi:hypothetical protein
MDSATAMPDETTPEPTRRTRTVWAALAALWLTGVAAGLASLAAYDNSPGVAARAPGRWPAASRLTLDPTRPTLVMLAHPRCTCTRASVGELAELIARTPRRPRTYVVFVKPGRVGSAIGWEKTDLWERAAAIPDVTVARDDDGHEAAQFGAETSGQTFLYAPDGQLLFSGGTTGARGHPGDNAGRATLLAMLRQDIQGRRTTKVFGCSLFAPGDRAADQHDHAGAAHAHTN